MKRVTNKMLDDLIQQINRAAGTPLTYCDTVGATPFKSNIGHYHIDAAYGGYKLVQTSNEGGGIRTIGHLGFVAKKEIYLQLIMFLEGLEVRKTNDK